MEELLESLLAKRELTHAFMRQNSRFSERCCAVALLRDRMRKWCEDLLDDLTLIGFEDVDCSSYKSPIALLSIIIEKCWRDIETSLVRVYKDVGWLHEKLNVLEPNTDQLWWFMAEDVNKRQQRVDDFISRYYQLHLLFQESVRLYLEIFRERNLFIFEKYRHY